MAPLARPALFALLIFALPLAAEAVSLTSYSVAPAMIYPASAGSTLATSSTIALAFSARVKVSVKAIGPTGSSVKTIYSSSGVTSPDPKLWDGTDSSGTPVAPGIYTILIAATSTATSSETLYDSSKTVVVATLPTPALPSFASQSYSLPLGSGWNLLSVPVVPGDARASHVFSDPAIDAAWSYDPADPASMGGWLAYDPAEEAVSNLTEIAAGEGYFIHTNASGSVAGTGTPLFAPGNTPPARALLAGWNLIGSYATSSEDIDDAFASIGWAGLDYTALFSLNPLSGSFFLPNLVGPGGAYWIFLPAAKPYAPSDL